MMVCTLSMMAMGVMEMYGGDVNGCGGKLIDISMSDVLGQGWLLCWQVWLQVDTSCWGRVRRDG